MSKPEAPEFQIERDYDARCAHARGMFNMATQRAETELDLALELADQIRQAELADLRHGKHQTVMFTPTIEDVAMVKRELGKPVRSVEEIKRDLDEEKFRQQFGITRMSEIQP